MVDSKSWMQSKTIIACIVALLSIIASTTGHALPDDMQSQLTDTLSKIADLIGAVSVLYAAWGRLTATKEIAPTIITPKGPPQ